LKIVALGIAIILFGISVTLVTPNTQTAYGLGISFMGLVLSFAGAFQSDTK
jgi:hypothetical protein